MLIVIAAAVCAGRAWPAAITVQGRKLLVDGAQFNIKGVDYSPVPVGSDWHYDWADVPSIYNSDLPLIRSMGANTVRTYQENNISQAFLDSAYQNGIYVIVGYGQNLWGQDFTNPATRAQFVNDFASFINTYKGNPAVLMWCFGNEVEEHTASKAAWYTLLKEAADKAHSIDPNHPITTANQDITELGVSALNADDTTLSSLDVWGVNVYKGKDFSQAFFTEMSTRTAKPFFLSEWGCDAYNGDKGAESQSLQASYIGAQWAGIGANLTSNGKACLGGLVFEWCDEWWKGDTIALTTSTIGGGGVKGSSYHDTENDWVNSAYTDDIYMNEEWWGLVSVAAGTALRTPRLAYYALKDLWNPSQAVASSSVTTLIQNEVKNYPNPLIAGRDVTRVEFTVAGAPQLEVVIFDLRGGKVFQQDNIVDLGSGLMSADWNGRDENNNIVPAGLYICRVKAKTPDREETKYRKIAVVK